MTKKRNTPSDLIKQAAQALIAVAEAHGLPVTDVIPLVQSVASKIIKRKKK